MKYYVASRLAQTVLTMGLASVVIFVLMHSVPGDPAVTILGANASQSMITAMRHKLGLDHSLWVQYAHWIAGVVRGNLGTSLTSGLPVGSLVKTAVPASLTLLVVGFAIASLIGLTAGVLAAARKGTWLDSVLGGGASLGYAMPVFWTGMLGLIIFVIHLHWLPTGEYISPFQHPVSAFRHVILPATIVGISSGSVLARFIRVAVVETLDKDYIRTARAKGLNETTILFKHAMRNALLPILTITGFQLGYLLGGQIVVEVFFAWPGVGQLTLNSVLARDYTTAEASLLLMVVWFSCINLAVDLLYAEVDPRVGRHT